MIPTSVRLDQLRAELELASRTLRRHAAAGQRSPRVDADSWAKLLDRAAVAVGGLLLRRSHAAAHVDAHFADTDPCPRRLRLE